MKNCTQLWCEARVKVKMLKTPHAWSAFGSSDVQKVQCFGAKHISNSKCANHSRFAPLLEVEMLKKCTALLHEAHVQAQMLKTLQVRSSFGRWDVEKVHAVLLWREAHFEVKMSKIFKDTSCMERSWKFRRSKSARCCGAKHIFKGKC